MNEDELHYRASLLEKQIRGFTIASTPGSLIWKFGNLAPSSEDIHERLTNIENSVNKLSIIGDQGLVATGSFKESFIISSGIAGGGDPL